VVRATTVFNPTGALCIKKDDTDPSNTTTFKYTISVVQFSTGNVSTLSRGHHQDMELFTKIHRVFLSFTLFTGHEGP
jgi:hypothetical protein